MTKSPLLAANTASAARPKVGIVGAGFAGLRAAGVLVDHGWDVTVLEARDRVGGRCHQSSYLGHSVDLGCNQIHGTDENPIFELAKATKTATFLTEGVHSIFLKDGTYLDGAAGTSLWTTKEELMAKATAYSRENTSSIDPEISLWAWFKAEVTARNFTPEEQDRLLQVVQDWGGFVGEDIRTQSLKNLWLETSMPGDNLFVSETYAKILECVTRPVIERCDLRTGEEVVWIESLLEPKSDGDHRTVIKTASGFQDTFDQVIVTAPLGWLQKNQDAFSPAMPDALLQALQSFNMCRLEKAFVHFPKAWWQHDTDRLGRPGRFATSTVFASPEYAPDTNPGQWTQEIFMYDNLAGADSHPTIVFYIYGENSHFLTEQLHGHDIESKAYRDILVRFLEPYYSRLPHYRADDPACRPSKCFCTDWEHDPYAGFGSYSHFTTPAGDMQAAIQTIRTGMGRERGIWIAGEHAAPDIALSTSVGAYWSGDQAANSVLNAKGYSAVFQA